MRSGLTAYEEPFRLRGEGGVLVDLLVPPGATRADPPRIGDQIMFASLIPDLIAAGATLTVECDQRLVPVLERSFPTIKARPPAAS